MQSFSLVVFDYVCVFTLQTTTMSIENLKHKCYYKDYEYPMPDDIAAKLMAAVDREDTSIPDALTLADRVLEIKYAAAVSPRLTNLPVNARNFILDSTLTSFFGPNINLKTTNDVAIASVLAMILQQPLT
jgi:hypothetical protein